MRFLRVFVIVSSILTALMQEGYSQTYKEVKVYLDHAAMLRLQSLDMDLGHVHGKPGEYLIGVFSEVDLEALHREGFLTEILIDDLQSHFQELITKDIPRSEKSSCEGGTISNPIDTVTVPTDYALGSMGGYPTYQEMLNHLDNMATKYPNLISEKAQIGDFTTHNGHPIYYAKLSNNVDPENPNGKPQVLYSALHHAREPGSLSSLIFFIYYLLENYGSNTLVNQILNERELYIIPCLNPDGYIYNEQIAPNGGGMWRKNRRNNGNGSFGVDLNRNYGFEWGTQYSSGNTFSDVYRGPFPFSEPEIQAMQYFTESHEFVMAFNNHTYGNLLLFPYGYAPNVPSPDDALYRDLTEKMVAVNKYNNMISANLYPAAGDSDDWMYGEQTTKNKILAMTPEIGESFWLPPSQITRVDQELLWQNMSMSLMADEFILFKPQVFANGITRDGSYSIGFDIENNGINPAETVSVKFHSNTEGLALETNEIIFNNPAHFQSIPGQFVLEFESPEMIPEILEYSIEVVYGTSSNTYSFSQSLNTGLVPVTIFEDQFSDLDAWEFDQPWGTTTTFFTSPPRSAADSPGGNYANNINSAMVMKEPIDLNLAESAFLSFSARWNIEYDYDLMQVSVVLPGGQKTTLCGQYTRTNQFDAIGYDGNQPSWIQETIDLTPFIGEEIRIEFRMISDAFVTEEGFYLDDLKITVLAPSENLVPAVTNLIPNNGDNNAPLASPLRVIFDQKIFLENEEGVQLITSEELEVPVSIYVLNDNELIIEPETGLNYETNYTVIVGPDVVRNFTGSFFEGISDWSFSTRAVPVPPTIVQTLPENNALEVPVDTEIFIEFDQVITDVNLDQIKLISEDGMGISIELASDVGNSKSNDFSLKPLENLSQGTNYDFFLYEESVLGSDGAWNIGSDTPVLTFTTVAPVSGLQNSGFEPFILYPNPSKDRQINLLVPDFHREAPIQYALMDMRGIILEAGNIDGSQGKVRLKLNHHPVGVYFFSINFGNGTQMFRILIEN